MYCATEMGLISMQGHSRGSSVGMLSMMARMELPRPPLAMFRFRMLISDPSALAADDDGTLEASLLYSSCLLSSWKCAVSRLYFSICWRNFSPLNILRLSLSSMAVLMSWWKMAFRKVFMACAGRTPCSVIVTTGRASIWHSSRFLSVQWYQSLISA